jgi:Zn-dependent protease with chaperone function
MNRSGPATFFDGKTTARHSVTVELDPAALLVQAEDGTVLARWTYDEMEQSTSSAGVFRIGRAGSGTLERIEVHDAELAAAIDELSVPVDRTGVIQRRGRRRIVFWSVAAVVSLLLVGIFGVPEIATRLAPYVPYSVELKLGEAVDQQVRAMINPGQQGQSFECGYAEKEKAGKAALDKMVGRLEKAAALRLPLKLKVVRQKQANAIALPGAYIYVFEGLITQAHAADEVAGVIAHEMGHVAHRDGMRSVLQAGGLAFLFGVVLGDFVGGGAVVIASKTILQLAYSRRVEADADGFSVQLMEKVGGDARALGAILSRISGSKEPEVRILLNHPATKERAEWIEGAASRTAAKAPLLEPAEWTALKSICAGQ